MFDASRLTHETDVQTKVINELIKIYKDLGENNINPEEKLKDFVGHTHIQMLRHYCNFNIFLFVISDNSC